MPTNKKVLEKTLEDFRGKMVHGFMVTFTDTVKVENESCVPTMEQGRLLEGVEEALGLASLIPSDEWSIMAIVHRKSHDTVIHITDGRVDWREVLQWAVDNGYTVTQTVTSPNHNGRLWFDTVITIPGVPGRINYMYQLG